MDRLITALGNAIYFPFLAPVVVIAAIWLAWQGLVRKRATRTIEGTIWMVIACAAAIWLIGRPADFTNVGTTVSNGVTSVLNTAFAKLPATAEQQLPARRHGRPAVGHRELLLHLGQRPRRPERERAVDGARLQAVAGRRVRHHPVRGSRGRTQPQTVVNQYGRQLLWAQAVAGNEQPVTAALFNAKQATYNGIAHAAAADQPGRVLAVPG